MSRFIERIDQDLGHIADGATPSSDAWEAVQARIAERANQPEMEIIMLDKNHTPPGRAIHGRWMLSTAAAIIVIIGGIFAFIRSTGESPVVVTDRTSTTGVATTTIAPSTTAPQVAGGVRLSIEGTIDVDLVDGELIVGTGSGVFEVSNGAEALGCERGTVLETYRFQTAVDKVMTCTSGSRRGTFTISAGAGQGGNASTWEIVEATDDFIGLSGSGFWDGRPSYLDETSFGNPIYVFVQEPQYTETLTGPVVFEHQDAIATIEGLLGAADVETLASYLTDEAFAGNERVSGGPNVSELLVEREILGRDATIVSCAEAGAETTMRCTLAIRSSITDALGQDPLLRDITFNFSDGLISTWPSFGWGAITQSREVAVEAGFREEFDQACPEDLPLGEQCAEYVTANLDSWIAAIPQN